MSNFYWLKLKKDFYKRHDIVILESMENGKEIELIYIKMLCEAIDHYGELRFNENIAYTPQMLSHVFNTTEEMMKTAIKALIDLELVEIDDSGTIKMLKMGSFVGYETDMAEKKRMQRNLPTLKNGSKRLNGSCLVTQDMKKHTVDEKRYGGHGMQALDRAFGKCELCGSDKEVRIHHNNGYSNELDDLVCLCISCHGIAHNKQNKGHIKIEREPYVHQLSTDCPPNVHQLSTSCPTNVCPDIDIEIDTDIDIEKDIESREVSVETPAPPKPKKRFVVPSLEEVQAYCTERNNGIDAQRFIDFYSAKNWYVGKNKMVDWKACIRTWENRNKSEVVYQKKKSVDDIPIMENEYSAEHLAQKEKESDEYLDQLLAEL